MPIVQQWSDLMVKCQLPVDTYLTDDGSVITVHSWSKSGWSAQTGQSGGHDSGHMRWERWTETGSSRLW